MRGRDEWVRVSWDEALDLVHNQLKRVRDEHGSTGIFAGSYGWFSCGSLHASRTLLQRYMNATGGFVGHKGLLYGAAQVIMPHVLGTIEVYEQQTSWESILESSDIIVLWSANPLTTMRIAWMSTDQKGLNISRNSKRVVNVLFVSTHKKKRNLPNVECRMDSSEYSNGCAINAWYCTYFS